MQKRALIFPPRRNTQSGQERRVGVELEFSNLSLDSAAETTRLMYGGRHRVESTFVHEVRGSGVGNFLLEFDSKYFKEGRYEQALDRIPLLDEGDRRSLEHYLMKLVSIVVPFELVTPPIPLSRLPEIDSLFAKFRDAGARGTFQSPLYAFGLHLNPELPEHTVEYLVRIVQAFVLLEPWLNSRVQMDFTRAVSPFVRPYPMQYQLLVLDTDYRPDFERFTADYVAFNPSRNRSLDLLPALSYLAGGAVPENVRNASAVSPRPALHYRLPNSTIDDPDWGVVREWNRWVQVEWLAEDDARRSELAREYRIRREDSSFRSDWTEYLEAGSIGGVESSGVGSSQRA